MDESSLTGEAEGVWKVTAGNTEPECKDYWRRDYCYAGTLVTQGSASILVDRIGAKTEYGKIGANVAAAPENPTPLQLQTGRLIKLCAGIAAVLFALVGCITYFNIPDHPFKSRIIESILSGITLAMGKRGSEVSREAADMILLDDNFSTIVHTIHDGRRIYDNIRKAVGYVFTIHIPIALTSLLAPLMGIAPSALMLLPLHVVLLELVIDPTCSIVLERQPAEKDIMDRPPRKCSEKLLDFRTLSKSVLQGLVLFAASFGTYYAYLTAHPDGAAAARAMGLSIFLLGNLLLVHVNSSVSELVIRTFRNLLADKVMTIVTLGTLSGLFLMLYSPVNSYLKLAPLDFAQMMAVIGIAFAAVAWYEIVKVFKKLIRKEKV